MADVDGGLSGGSADARTVPRSWVRRNLLGRNVATSTLNTLINALAGLVTLPFLIAQLGLETYGLWVLIVATAGSLTALDFGIAAGVGRLVAVQVHDGDGAAISRIASTAFRLLLALAFLAALLSLLAALIFPHAFAVSAERTLDVQWALLAVGMTSALYFPAALFDGLLWGHERFDLHNAVEIPVVVGRLVLTLLLVHPGSSLLDLALIVSLPTLLGYGVRIVLGFRLERGLVLNAHAPDAHVRRELLHFGRWFGVLSFVRSNVPGLASMIIGFILGPAAVAIFTVPRLLISYANWIMAAATQAIGPRAAVLFLSSDHDAQRQLFLLGSRLALGLSTYLTGGMILLGDTFLDLWQPNKAGVEYTLLVILSLGELIPLSQWLSYSILVGMGRTRFLALLAIAEAACMGIGAAAMAGSLGLTGVAASVALTSFVFRGLAQAAYGCRSHDVSFSDYVRTTVLPVVLAAALPIAASAGTLALWKPASWLAFIAAGSMYTALFVLAMRFVLPLPWAPGLHANAPQVMERSKP